MLRALIDRLRSAAHRDTQEHSHPQPEMDHQYLQQICRQIRMVLREADATITDDTPLHTAPAWQHREWADHLAQKLCVTVTADDIVQQRTIGGLAHWIYRNNISDATLEQMRSIGW